MSGPRTVWITGLGLVTSIGTGVDAFRAGLRRATSPIRAIDRFDASPFRSRVAAQIDDFDPAAYMDARSVRALDRFSQFGVAAGRLALDDAAFRPGEAGHPDPQRVGIYLGSALGGVAFAEEQHERFMDGGIRRVAPTLALAVFGGAAPANLGITLGIRGPILSTANSCASGAVALGEALGAIRSGEVDAAIAGGVECPLSPLSFGAFDLIRALANAHNDHPDRGLPSVRRRPQRLRPGRRGGHARARGSGGRSASGRRPVCRAARIRRLVRRVPHGPAATRRERCGTRGSVRADRCRRLCRNPSTT